MAAALATPALSAGCGEAECTVDFTSQKTWSSNPSSRGGLLTQNVGHICSETAVGDAWGVGVVRLSQDH